MLSKSRPLLRACATPARAGSSCVARQRWKTRFSAYISPGALQPTSSVATATLTATADRVPRPSCVKPPGSHSVRIKEFERTTVECGQNANPTRGSNRYEQRRTEHSKRARTDRVREHADGDTRLGTQPSHCRLRLVHAPTACPAGG